MIETVGLREIRARQDVEFRSYQSKQQDLTLTDTPNYTHPPTHRTIKQCTPEYLSKARCKLVPLHAPTRDQRVAPERQQLHQAAAVYPKPVIANNNVLCVAGNKRSILVCGMYDGEEV